MGPLHAGCSRCNAPLGESYELTPKGDVVCLGCSIAERMEALEAVGRGSDDWAGERRCRRCRGVCSAGLMIDYQTRQVTSVSLFPVEDARIEEGSETVFRCGRCGHEFRLMNRVMRARAVYAALYATTAGAVLGFVPLGILRSALGWLGFLVLLSLGAFLGAKPLLEDRRLRAMHPPV